MGDADTKRIPSARSVACDNGCSAKAAHSFNDTPFCAGCLPEAQQMQWDEDGDFFETIAGERERCWVVGRFTMMAPL